jgi:signal transduction histidine kinase
MFDNQKHGVTRVRLGQFIRNNVEPILAEWESFARGIWPPGAQADPAELRDSAAEILAAVVADMDSAQSPRERSEKSMGRGAHGAQSDRLDHASQVHGVARVGSGLALAAVVAEYRALRASVLRLWRTSDPAADGHDLDDVTRFNESIDQSLALAVDAFTHRLDAARKMFLAMLTHDLRNPLSAITLTTKLASAEAGGIGELPAQLEQILQSATAIGDLTNDLADFANSSLGAGLPLSPAPVDLRELCDGVFRETRAAHPGRTIHRDTRGGNFAGTWDAHRVRQLVANLLRNAVQHGSPTEPVTLTLDGTSGDAVVLSVHNLGPPIPADVLPMIFDPLVRAPTTVQARRAPGSVGLGLYIVREIAAAHGGTANLTSTPDAGTTATVRLPRHARPTPAAE